VVPESVVDPVLRAGIRVACARRLRAERSRDAAAWVDELRRSPIAIETAAANAQHYEVEPELFRLILGPRRTYSCCLWDGARTLAEAEEAMLARTCERAGVEDGMELLDLGCGWGSLTTWLAERYPSARILAVSNSRSQRSTIEARGHANVEVVTADANVFDPRRRFDRVLSVEMMEHTRNWESLLGRAASWLEPGGRMFVHVFSHRELAYPYEDGWMARNFFTGGSMPSHDLIRAFDRDLGVERDWWLDGTHYERTANAWVENLDAERTAVRRLVGRKGYWAWRAFLLACAELWGYRDGREWGVSHYVLSPDAARPAGAGLELQGESAVLRTSESAPHI
jgi:cyclopropane-fatty-acyl-phospholipid synthase